MPTTNGGGDAVFNEMLQFTVDVDQFAADLKQIESQWDASLSRMGESTAANGFKATDLFDPKAIETQIQGLQSTIQELATSIGNAFGTLTKNINEQLDEVQAKAEKAASTVASAGGSGEEGGTPGTGSGMHPRVRSFGFGQSTGSFFGDIKEGFAGSAISMGQMVGAMTRFMLLWQGIQIVIGAVKDALEAIPKFIEGIGEVLKGVMSGGFEYLEKLNDKHAQLVQKLDQYKSRWEGIVAAPAFKELNEILAAIAGWIEKNRKLLDGFAQALGNAIGGLFDSLVKLGNTSLDPLVFVFRTLVMMTSNMLYTLRETVDVINLIAKIGKIEASNPNPGDGSFSDDTGQSKAFQAAFAARDKEQQKNEADRLALINSVMPGAKGANVKGFPLESKDTLQDLRQSFQDTFSKIREEYDKTREGYESLIKRHQASVQEMAPAIEASWGAEVKAIQAAIDHLKAHAVQTGANIQKVKAFGESMDKALHNFDRTKDKALTTLGDRVFNEQGTQTKMGLDAQAKMSQLDSEAEINIAQHLAKEKLITEEDSINRIMKARKKAHDDQMNIWAVELAALGSNTTKYKALQEKMIESDQTFYKSEVSGLHDLSDQHEKAIREWESLELGKAQIASRDAQLAASEARSGGASAFNLHGLDVDAATAKLTEMQVAAQNAFAEYIRAVKQELDPQALEAYHQAVMRALQSVDQATNDLDNKRSSGGIVASLFGGDESITKHFSDTSEGAKSLTTAFKNLNSAVQTIQNGFKQGGLFGGLGAIGSVGGGFMSEIGQSLGKGSAIGSFLSEAGPIAGAAGTLFSILGSVFSNAAKNIAADVEKSYKKIIQDYQAGNTDFSTTMANLEKERQDAISRLGGKKKGKSELTGILDQINQAEQQITQHADQVKKSFEEQLVIISQGNKVAQDWVKTWTDINKQVKEYMDNGGNALYAHQFLTQQFNQQLTDLQSQYNDAEEQAIKDAFTMNDLLDARAKIQDQINKLTKKEDDSIERREAGAITANQQLADQKKTLEDQLAQNKQDLDVATAKWSKEQQLFGLTGDINKLHQIDADLQMKSLQDQIDKWSSIKYIIDQIHAEMAAGFNPNSSFGSNGLFAGVSPIQGLDPGAIPGFGAAGAPTYNIVVHSPYGGDNPYGAGRQIGTGIADELYYRRRGGLLN